VEENPVKKLKEEPAKTEEKAISKEDSSLTIAIQEINEIFAEKISENKSGPSEEDTVEIQLPDFVEDSSPSEKKAEIKEEILDLENLKFLEKADRGRKITEAGRKYLDSFAKKIFDAENKKNAK
jgi:hypothetical protein